MALKVTINRCLSLVDEKCRGRIELFKICCYKEIIDYEAKLLNTLLIIFQQKRPPPVMFYSFHK